jgi:hypothetical protein
MIILSPFFHFAGPPVLQLDLHVFVKAENKELQIGMPVISAQYSECYAIV